MDSGGQSVAKLGAGAYDCTAAWGITLGRGLHPDVAMTSIDLLIYPAHVEFWAAFGATRVVTARRHGARPVAAERVSAGQAEKVAPWSRTLLGVHFLAFGVMYFSMGAAVIPTACRGGSPVTRSMRA